MRILVVEDEAKLANLIRRGLQDEGLAADIAGRGEDALWMAGSTEYDVVVLDVMLPATHGLGTRRVSLCMESDSRPAGRKALRH